MVYAGIAEYLERIWGVTEFWMNDRRIMKTTDGTWISIQ